MKVHVLQHVPFEGIGSMEPWLLARGALLSHTCFFQPNPQLPSPEGWDLIIAMGGPMSVNDEATLPWLVAEKAFLHQAMAAGVPVLGVCLGAQLIASAQGAAVDPAPQREIGWFEIEGLPAPAGGFAFPPRLEVFHWHGETFALPTGAVRLARSAACENQAFQLGARVIGLQFHLEITPAAAAAMVSHCRAELTPGPFVQTEPALLAAPADLYESSNRLMEQVLTYLTVPGR
jgi:GMP synthase-like glutamine amidotransferase